MKDSALSVIRHILTFIGGFLVAKGWLSEAGLEIVGAILAAIGVVWGAVDEYQASKKP